MNTKKTLHSYLNRFRTEGRYGRYRMFYRYCTPFLLKCREEGISIPTIAEFLRKKFKDNQIITADLFKFCRQELGLPNLMEMKNDRRRNQEDD